MYKLSSVELDFHNSFIIGAKGTTPYDCLQIPSAVTENDKCVQTSKATGVCVEV